MATPPNQRRPVNPSEAKDDVRSAARLTVDARTILASNLARLETPELEEVARSLLAAPFPSSAQNAYIESLARTAMPRRSHRIGHAERIFSLFDEAKKHIGGPGITLRTATVALRMELERGTHLNLSNGFRWSSRIWHGRLSREGVFDPHSDAAKNIATILRAFAGEPIGMAREHGQRTGYCCFCGRSLTDEERSVALGYGPVCAKHWGLPWKKVATVENPKPAVPINLAPSPRTKFAPAEEPLTDAAIKRTTEFDYVLWSDSSKKGKIVAQIPANWLVLPRPDDDSDIRTRLAAFLAAHDIPHDGGWREVQVRYTAPAGSRSTRHWRLFVVRVTDHVSEILAQFPGEIA